MPIGRGLELGRPRLGRQVLPPTVGEQTHDVATFELGGHPEADVEHRPRRDAGEDALALGQLACRAHRVRDVHQEPTVQHRLVEDRRHESVVEGTEPVHQVPQLRFRRDHLHVRVVALQAPADPGEGPAGPETGDEVRDLGQVPDDLLAGALLVRSRVRGVPVLERHVVAVVAREPSRDLDRAVRPLVAGREHDLCAEQLEEPDPLLARVVRDHDGQPVPLAPGDHRQRDPRVARRGLQDRAPRGELARVLGGLDHRLRDPILERAGRVLPLELGPDPNSRRAQARQADERRVADRVEDVVEPHRARLGAGVANERARHGFGGGIDADYRSVAGGRPVQRPPATAGRIETVSSGSTSVSSEPR